MMGFVLRNRWFMR